MEATKLLKFLIVFNFSGRTAQSVDCGVYHSCAVLIGGGLACWGNNGYGQLGIGTNVNVGDTAATLGSNFDLVLLGTGSSQA